MNYNHLVAIILTLYLCCTFSGYCQKGIDYNGIETKNVLSYKVDEIIVMRFGGSSTHYNVSDIRLISKVDLGPGNIRVITPVYKDGIQSTKIYLEVMAGTKRHAKDQQKNVVFEIIVENNQTDITNSSRATLAEKEALVTILKKVVLNNKETYDRTRPVNARQKVSRQQNETNQRNSREKVLTQNTKKSSAYLANSKDDANKQVAKLLKPVVARNRLKNVDAYKPVKKNQEYFPKKLLRSIHHLFPLV